MKLRAVGAPLAVIAVFPVLAAVLVSGAPATQVFSSEVFDYEEGRATYMENCASCHGPDGNWIDGADIGAPPDGSRDEVLRAVIGGVPDSPMGPSGLTVFEATTVAAYLESLGVERLTLTDADAGRGQDLVETHGCLECHAIGSDGGLIGPDLTEIGRFRTTFTLRESILDPDAEVRIENRFVNVALANGAEIRGRLLNQDSFSVQLLSMEERLVAVDKDEMEGMDFIGSPMPSYRGRMSPDDIGDVVRFLSGLGR
jgi:putative heme-binding domain-containing protein